MYGKKLTPEHCQALSIANKKSKSTEHRRKIGDAQRGKKNHNYGKRLSPETRTKMTESQNFDGQSERQLKANNNLLCSIKRVLQFQSQMV